MTPERTTHSVLLGPLAGRLAGALAVVVGGMALVGWAFDIAVLKSIRPDWVAMKANTALCFVLVGVVLLLSRGSSAFRLQPSAFFSRLSRLCTLLVGLIGLLSLAEYAFGWNLGFDQWLFPEPVGAVGTSHPGRMAPDAALCFVLLAAGLALIRRSRQSMRALVAAVLIGALVTIAALAEILSYFTPTLRTYGWGGLTMMALPTAVVFAILGVALVLIARQAIVAESAPLAPTRSRPDARTGITFLLIFVLLAVGIIATGTHYYRSVEVTFRKETHQQLEAIADLKQSQLEQYRRERLGDGGFFAQNAGFAALVRRVLENPEDAEAQSQLRVWFGRMLGQNNYDVVRLLDAQGAVHLTSSDRPVPVPAALLSRLPEIFRTGQVTFQDFHRNEHDQRIYLDVLAPIFDERDASRPLGIVNLRIDPASYLYPFINRWPTGSQTAETLLVRRDGNDVLFLNELKFQKNAALELRIPLARTEVLAVKAVLSQTGIVEGTDYRGAPAMAALRAVPNSPWFLVARMDVAEVYAPMRARLWQVVGGIVVLLFGAGAGVGLLWRQQSARFDREQAESAEALRESGAKFRAVAELSPMAIYASSGSDQKAEYINEAFYKIFGFSMEDVPTVGQWWIKAFPDEKYRQQVIDQWTHNIEQADRNHTDVEVLECVCICKDGSAKDIAWVGKTIGGEFWAFGYDLTERKRAEAELRESEERFRRAVVDSPFPIMLHAENGAVLQVSNSWREITGYTHEELATIADWTERAYGTRAAPVVEEIESLYGLERRKYEGDYPIRTKSGGTRIWEFSSAPVGKLPDGRRIVISMAMDVTERRQAEDAAKREQALSKTIIDSIPGTFYMLDEAGRYVRWNAYQRDEIVGQPEERVAGMNAAETIHPEDRALIQSKIADVLVHGSDQIVEGRVLLRGGPAYRWLLMTGRRIMVEGRPFLVGIGIDRTERMQAEERLRIQAEHLAKSNEELNRFNRLMAGRELRTIELKQQVNDLAAQLGQSRPYPLAFLDAAAAEIVRTNPKPSDQGAEVSKTQKEKSP